MLEVSVTKYNDMKKGEIYQLKTDFRDNYSPECYNHPFIYWEDNSADYTGIMLTSSDNQDYKNIELREEYFKSGFKIKFGKSVKKPKSFIAPLYLLKDVKYEHLEKVGELSDAGTNFISSIINTLKYTNWKTHMKLA